LDDLVGRLGSVPHASSASFAGIAIRTCDRPALLARLLRSVAALEARYARAYHYVVLDDSRDAANRAANRQCVAKNERLDCAYYDLTDTSLVEQELRHAFPDAAKELDWLLGPPGPGEATYGRPINLALLLTAGQRVLLLDDDVMLEPRRPPIVEPGFAVSSEADELFCYPDRGTLDNACLAVDIDPFATHLDCLGELLGPLWARFAQGSSRPALLRLGSNDADRFVAGARVLFTQNHVAGDPGSALFPYHLLALPPASRTRLLADPAWAQYALRERIHWRGQSRLRLCPKRPLTFTTLAGLDNSVLMPPTVRAHRNEDLLLGDMAQYIHTGGWLADLPLALPHWRDPAKTWLDASATFAQEPVHFLLDYLALRAPSVLSDRPEERLGSVGTLFVDLAAASERRISVLLEEQAADAASRVLFSIAQQLDDPALPAQWKDTLRPWLDSPALSTDPARLRERIASPATVRELARSYGHALAVWPTLWEYGVRLSYQSTPPRRSM